MPFFKRLKKKKKYLRLQLEMGELAGITFYRGVSQS